MWIWLKIFCLLKKITMKHTWNFESANSLNLWHNLDISCQLCVDILWQTDVKYVHCSKFWVANNIDPDKFSKFCYDTMQTLSHGVL